MVPLFGLVGKTVNESLNRAIHSRRIFGQGHVPQTGQDDGLRIVDLVGNGMGHLRAVGPGQILGEEGRGFEIAGQWLGMGRIWVGASCCGKAERILDKATEWAANRQQFGKPIGQFQATGFRLANGAMNPRAADLMVTNAVERHERGQMADQDAAMVKVFCWEMLGQIADDAVQIHGGMGLMEELPIQRLWRDSRLERIWDGTSEIQRHIITRSMLRPLGA